MKNNRLKNEYRLNVIVNGNSQAEGLNLVKEALLNSL
jgi:hypothetical protein